MNINSNNNKFSQPAFKATLKHNEHLEEVLNHINHEDKKELDRVLGHFSTVAKDDVVELRKTKENNSEIYSLVNAKNDKKNVFVCRMFPEVISEDDGHINHRQHEKIGFVAESLIETIRHAATKFSDAFHSLFTEESHPGHRLKDYYI